MPSSFPALVVTIANRARNAFCDGDELIVDINNNRLYAKLQLPEPKASIALEFFTHWLDGLQSASLGALVILRRNGSLRWRCQRTYSKRLVSEGHTFETVNFLLPPPEDAPTFSLDGRELESVWNWTSISGGSRAGMKRTVDAPRRRFHPYERPARPEAPGSVRRVILDDDTDTEDLSAPGQPSESHIVDTETEDLAVPEVVPELQPESPSHIVDTETEDPVVPEVAPELQPEPPVSDLQLNLATLQSAFDAVKAQVAKMQDAHENAKPVCPVCLCDNETPTVYRCGHAYCADCAPKMRGLPCGKCRQPLHGASVRVYL